MIEKKLISIIVPIYNVEKYLSACIESLLNQTYRNTEIILVNDGSTDKSEEIIETYKQKDSRIISIKKENGGLSDARNVGLDNAKGEYIVFVDSDDYIHTEMISKLYNNIGESDISVCGIGLVDEQGHWISKMCEDSEDFMCSGEDAALLLYEKGRNYYKGCSVEMVVAWNKLYKREVWKEIRFPFGKIHEDVFTTYKIFNNSSSIRYCSEPLYYYRQRGNSIKKQQFGQKNIDYLDALLQQTSFYEENGQLVHFRAAAKVLLSSIQSTYYRMINSDGERLSDKFQRFEDIYVSLGSKPEITRSFSRPFSVLNLLYIKHRPLWRIVYSILIRYGRLRLE